MVVIKIDNREGALKALIKQDSGLNNENVIYENLPLGDILISVNECVSFVFERKTYTDLLASISDGRYKSQKQRLMEAYPVDNVFYILEGSLPSYAKQQGDSNIITGVVINTLMRDKIGIFYTRDVNETYHLLLHIVKRINADPNKYICKPKLHADDANINIKKASNSTFKNILSQIPGVSIKSAESMINKWACFQHMYQQLMSMTHEQRIKTLSTLTTTDNKGKSRKLSCKVVENVVQALFDDEDKKLSGDNMNINTQNLKDT